MKATITILTFITLCAIWLSLTLTELSSRLSALEVALSQQSANLENDLVLPLLNHFDEEMEHHRRSLVLEFAATFGEVIAICNAEIERASR